MLTFTPPRSINLAPTRRERRQGKVHTTTGRMVTKRKVVSVKKRMAVVSTAKSPRKTVKTVKRNLMFEEGPKKGMKSPRKAVRMATPSKVEGYPAPGSFPSSLSCSLSPLLLAQGA